MLHDTRATLIVGYVTRPGGIATACQALRDALAAAAVERRTGRASLTDFAPDVLLAATPDVADALSERVIGELPDDLRTTLETLVGTSFDRGAAARALGIHRNTLLHRAARVRELTGVDLATLPGRVTAYLAVRRLDQHTRTAPPPPLRRARPHG
jgi:DNA-binding PucR family transcriptional regulator